MKARILFIGLVTLALLIAANLAFAGIPQQMNYQGKLTNDSGTPVDDSDYVMIFRIYDVATGGSSLWDETDTVSVEGGLFNVILGLKTPIDLPFDEDYWLGIQVGTGSDEMTPRHKLTSVGYGYKAENSDMVDGFHVSSTPTAGWLYPLDGSAKIPNDRLYTGSGNGLDADKVDNIHASTTPTPNYLYPLDGSGKIPNNRLYTGSGNGLDADMVDGQHASAFLTTSNDHGRYGVAPDLYEETQALSTKYLNITATAVNSDKVDGYHAGNASGNVPVSNGALNTNLNADMVDGQHASAFLTTSNDYGRYGVASNLYEGTKHIFSWNDNVSGSAVGLELHSSNSHAFAGYTSAGTQAPEYAAIRGEHSTRYSLGALGVYNIGVYGGAGNGTFAGKFDGPVEIVCTSSSYDGIASQTSQSGRSAVTGKNSSYNTWGGLGYRNYGVWGYQGSGAKAGYFDGNVQVTGNLTKGSGSFKIDHPLDPENKYLSHSFVESPDMMNVYNGNALLDANGEAVVELPDYFEALNRDFRYQLTPVGAPGPNLYIAEKFTNNRFKIAGGQPGMEVSWQVTGIRKDPYAEANRIQVEVNKPPAERGKYLHPKAYGLGPEYGISHGDQRRVEK